jgi:hypothetical protein
MKNFDLQDCDLELEQNSKSYHRVNHYSSTSSDVEGSDFPNRQIVVADGKGIVDSKEEGVVRKVKVLAFLVLAISITGALIVYFYTTFSEYRYFELQFKDDANKVL